MNFLNYENGLDGLIIHPLFSLMLSLLLICGVFKLGSLIYFSKLKNILNFTHSIFINPILGFLFILLFINPVIYLTTFCTIFLQTLSFLLIFIGVIGLFKFDKQKIKIYFNRINNTGFYQDKVSLIILSLYFIISLGPITNADSLDYHIGVPLDILKNSKLVFHPEWFASNTAGVGDFLNGIGLSIGAEQFPGLIQFVCIFCIYGIIRFPLYHINSLNSKFLSNIALCFLSTPVLLFLGSSSKPQLIALLFITSSLSIFYLIKLNISKSKKEIFSSLLLIYLLLIFAGLIKYNYFLSALLISILTLPILIKVRFAIHRYLFLLIIPISILLPYILWKYFNYQLNIFDSIYNMLPINFPGYKNYQIYLRNFRDNNTYFPFSLFVPFSFGTLSTSIGFSTILFLTVFKIKYRPIIILIILHISLTYFLGQINARFLFETLLIIIISLIYFQKDLPFFYYKIFSFILHLQSFIIIISLSFFSYSLVLNSFTLSGRKSVMNKTANGYSLFNWVNSQIQPNDSNLIIVTHRSLSLSKYPSISTEWNNYAKTDNEKKYYINLIKKKRPKYLIILDDTLSFPHFNGYEKTLLNKFTGHEATRNPFNKGSSYTAYLFKLSKTK